MLKHAMDLLRGERRNSFLPARLVGASALLRGAHDNNPPMHDQAMNMPYGKQRSSVSPVRLLRAAANAGRSGCGPQEWKSGVSSASHVVVWN